MKNKNKTTEDQWEKQIRALKLLITEKNKKLKSIEGIFPKGMRNNEFKNEIYKTKKWENKVKQKDLKFETNRYNYGFQQYETIRSSGDSMYNGKIRVDEAEMDQTNLLEYMIKFDHKSWLRSKEDKEKKNQNTFHSVNASYKGL